MHQSPDRNHTQERPESESSPKYKGVYMADYRPEILQQKQLLAQMKPMHRLPESLAPSHNNSAPQVAPTATEPPIRSPKIREQPAKVVQRGTDQRITERSAVKYAFLNPTVAQRARVGEEELEVESEAQQQRLAYSKVYSSGNPVSLGVPQIVDLVNPQGDDRINAIYVLTDILRRVNGLWERIGDVIPDSLTALHTAYGPVKTFRLTTLSDDFREEHLRNPGSDANRVLHQSIGEIQTYTQQDTDDYMTYSASAGENIDLKKLYDELHLANSLLYEVSEALNETGQEEVKEDEQHSAGNELLYFGNKIITATWGSSNPGDFGKNATDIYIWNALKMKSDAGDQGLGEVIQQFVDLLAQKQGAPQGAAYTVYLESEAHLRGYYEGRLGFTVTQE